MLPVFVAGCGRSGTTMVAALLGRRADVVVPPEAQFLVQGLAQRAKGGDFALAVAGSWRLGLWDLGPSAPAVDDLAGQEPADVMARLAQAYAIARGRPDARFWVDHTPSHIVHARTVLELFPQAHLIHLVRDPRAVTASVLPLDWGPASAREAARWWLGRVAAGLAAESAYPERVHRVHYEDVVRDADAALGPVADAVGLGLRAAEPGPSGVPAYTRAQHRLVGSAPDPARIAAWRTTLTPAQIEMVESEVGDCLALLGYEPETAARFERSTVGAGEALGALARKTGKSWRRTVRRRRQGARAAGRRPSD